MFFALAALRISDALQKEAIGRRQVAPENHWAHIAHTANMQVFPADNPMKETQPACATLTGWEVVSIFLKFCTPGVSIETS